MGRADAAAPSTNTTSWYVVRDVCTRSILTVHITDGAVLVCGRNTQNWYLLGMNGKEPKFVRAQGFVMMIYKESHVKGDAESRIMEARRVGRRCNSSGGWRQHIPSRGQHGQSSRQELGTRVFLDKDRSKMKAAETNNLKSMKGIMKTELSMKT